MREKMPDQLSGEALLAESHRRYDYDAEHHAVAYMTANLAANDLRSRIGYQMTEHEYRIARLSASIALVVNEQQLTHLCQ